MEDSVADKKKPRCGPCMKWIGTPSFHLLCNFLLSQWGDWMWQFSVGLYLVHLSDGHLRLAATFGFTGGTCVLLFGGIIGDWVDRNGRLKVVRTSLFMQNISVALSASAVCLVLVLEPNVSDLGQGSPARYFMEGSIVVLAVIAQLASVAYKIAIEKDWIIVIAAGKSSVLANLNAITRSLDLLCKVVSPLSVGFIMSRFSMFASACLIAAWNVVSVFLEYGLLSSIYSQVPELAKKGIQETKDSEFGLLRDKSAANDIGDEGVEEERMRRIMEERTEAEKDNQCCVVRIFEPFLLLFTGWRTYARQSVVFAGISLACLYMTVLGFDSITLGYIYANHVSEFMVGVCMGLAGLTGIIGTLLFTIMAKRIGLERTGVFAFLAELTCLILALASVWAPGSKFDLHSAFSGSHKHLLLSTNEIISAHVTTPQFMWPNSSSSAIRNASSFQDFNNSMHLSHETSTSGEEMNIFPLQNISMILLLVGIIMSRIGLWMADLVVTQLMQESIAERERGIVNGIQNSLNMLMDMLKFALVIFLPQIEIFGLHIILSFSFISAGTAFFCFHVARTAKRRRKKPGIEDNNNKGPKDLFI